MKGEIYVFNKQLKANINELDVKIGELTKELESAEDSVEYHVIAEKIDALTKVRCQLTESKVSESYSKEIISGLIGVGAMVLVLKHEKTDIITTKAFSMATKLFKGV